MIEHISPTSRGGETSADNLALACQGCNNYKDNKTESTDPIDAQPATLFNLRTTLWSDHFAWNENTTLLIGLTSIGRAAVNALRLNREGVVNLR